MHSLPVFVRIHGRPVVLVGEGGAAEAKRRLIERAGGHIVDEADGAARLAFLVPGEGVDVEQAAARLRARGLLVNVADRPDLCDFTLPAIVDRDPVLIAIGTGGTSAGLAKELRQRLEAMLPPTLGALALRLADMRERLRARFADAAERRRMIDAALADGGPLDPFGMVDDARIEAWLDGDAPAGELVRLTLASADPDDLTLRAARLLGRADALWHDGRVPESILSRARADAVRIVSPAPPPAPDRGLILWLEMAP